MNPVLIITDTERITKEKALCDASVIFLQGFYDLITPLGVTFTIEEMTGASQIILNNHGRTTNQLEVLLEDKLIEKAGGSNFNGVLISNEKLREMTEKPDVTNIYTYIRQSYPKFYLSSQMIITPAFLELINGVVSKKATAYSTITALYTYYTKNDKGAELATMLFSVANKLNEYETYLGRVPVPAHPTYSGLSKQVEGIEFVGYVHRPILGYIRAAEELYPDYVVA
jgi:hypothetical protein